MKFWDRGRKKAQEDLKASRRGNWEKGQPGREREKREKGIQNPSTRQKQGTPFFCPLRGEKKMRKDLK